MSEVRRALRESWWLFDVAPDALLGVDGEGRVVFANVQAHTLFGWDPEQLMGQLVEVLLPQRSRDRHKVLRQGYAAAPALRPMGGGLELFARRRDGTEFPAEISLAPVAGDEGDDGVVVIAAVRDVTEQHRARSRFHTLLEGAPDAVVGLAGDGSVLLMNAPAEDLFVTSRALAVGAPYRDLLAGQLTANGGAAVDLVPEEDRATLEAGVEEVLLGRRDALTLRYRVATSDGGHAVLEANVRALADGPGNGGMLIISRDVSAHVELEGALRAAKEEAVEANEAKDRFLSRMSHELRTPLNAILGFGQLLARKDLDADDADSVRQVMRGGRHLLGLVNELLDIARIESEELVEASGPVALGPVVGGVLELLGPLASAGQIQLDGSSPAACDAWVLADRDRLRQVLLNLVANGIKYNRPGGRVALQAVPAGSVVRIEVVDDGWGISEADRHRLFQPFDRLGAVLTEVEGSGIGLALSRGLVRAMGGSMGVESEEGRGSTFWVELPASSPDAGPSASASPDVRAATVLLVEDDPANALLTRRVLARLPNITVVVAGTGAEGLTHAAEIEPDLIILDLQLPDMAGEQILAALRRQARTRAIPTIVLSGDVHPDRLAALRAAGARDTVSKPIDLPAFLLTVSEILARRPR